jgi:hypothetical protein
MAFRVRQPDEEALTLTKGFAASVSSQLPSLSLVILWLMHWQMGDLDGLSDGVIHKVRRRKRDNEKMNPVVRANMKRATNYMMAANGDLDHWLSSAGLKGNS